MATIYQALEWQRVVFLKHEGQQKIRPPGLRFSRVALFLYLLLLLFFSTQQFIETKKMEKQKPFHEERFRTYVELADTVSKLATLPRESKESNEAIRHYWQLVFGKVEMLADEDVRKITRKTSTWVRECLEDNPDSSKKEACIDVSGGYIAMQVSKTVEKSFKRSLLVPVE